MAYPFPFFEFFALAPQNLVMAMLAVHLTLLILLLTGTRTRIAQALMAPLVTIIFLRSASYYSNHLSYYVLLNWFLIAAPSERYLSWDSIRKREALGIAARDAWRKERVPLFFIRICMTLTGMLYLSTAAHKLLAGWAMRWAFTDEALFFMGADHVLAPMWRAIVASGFGPIPVFGYVTLLTICGIGAFDEKRKKTFALLATIMHAIMFIMVPDATVAVFALMTLSVWWAHALSDFEPDRARHAWLM